MKNFDIEKLERRNIYTVPPGSFDALQARVLMDTVGQLPASAEPKSREINSIKWFYAAAAALALLLGFAFLLNQNSEPSGTTPVIAKSKPSPSVENHTPAIMVAKPLIPSSPVISAPVKKILAVKPAKIRPTTKTETPHLAKNDNVKEKKIVLAEEKTDYLSKEELTEQIISELSGQELAELAKNTEQDVYLELYN